MAGILLLLFVGFLFLPFFLSTDNPEMKIATSLDEDNEEPVGNQILGDKKTHQNDDMLPLGTLSGSEFLQMYLLKENYSNKDYIDLFEQIYKETETELINELVMLFFELFQPKDGKFVSYTDSEIEDIIMKALDLIRDEKTRETAIGNASGILNDYELSSIFDEMNRILTIDQLDKLASQYVNYRLLNGKTAITDTSIYKHYELRNGTKALEEISRRSEALATFISDNTVDATAVLEAANIAANNEPPSKDNFRAYMNWVVSQTLLLNNDDTEIFINQQFSALDENQKRQFIVHEPDLIGLVAEGSLLPYIDRRYTEYYDALIRYSDFDSKLVSGNLSLLDIIFKSSTSYQTVQHIDGLIKDGLGTYPSYEGAELAVSMIKDQHLYISSSDFNIDDYITEGEKNQSLGDTQKLY